MTTPDAWATALRQAAEQLGHPVPAIPRTVAGITQALEERRRDEFRAELDGLGDGISFEVLLDTWWTQAVIDSEEGEDARERTLEFADLAVSLRVKAASSSRDYTPAPVIDNIAGAYGLLAW